MAAIASMMDAEAYDAWYRTPRGQWVGETEFRLLARLLQWQPNESLLDIGCGTGYFTRRFAQENRRAVIGLDPNLAWLSFAQTHRAENERFVAGVGGKLPFPDRTVSVAALCFAQDQFALLSEMVHVTRKRFVIGLLNRASLLYWQKGRQGGTGAYRGAHWHMATEIRVLLERLPVSNVAVHSRVFLPAGGQLGRWMERVLPSQLLIGSFLVVVGDRSGKSLRDCPQCGQGHMVCIETFLPGAMPRGPPRDPS